MERDLKALVLLITNRREGYYEIGLALQEINENRLYVEWEESFGSFCQKHLGMARVQAYRYISAAKVANNLQPIGYKPLNEAQARVLAKLPACKQILAFQFALDLAQTQKRKVCTPDIIKGMENVSMQSSTEETLVMSQQMQRACQAFSAALKKEWEKQFQKSSKLAIINQLQAWLRSIRRK